MHSKILATSSFWIVMMPGMDATNVVAFAEQKYRGRRCYYADRDQGPSGRYVTGLKIGARLSGQPFSFYGVADAVEVR